jgi:hypothetical protein
MEDPAYPPAGWALCGSPGFNGTTPASSPIGGGGQNQSHLISSVLCCSRVGWVPGICLAWALSVFCGFLAHYPFDLLFCIAPFPGSMLNCTHTSPLRHRSFRAKLNGACSDFRHTTALSAHAVVRACGCQGQPLVIGVRQSVLLTHAVSIKGECCWWSFR